MSLAAFRIAWVAMMAAMMLPTVLPVVGRYARAAAGNAVPAIVFVAGHLAVWSVVGIPAFVASTHLNPALHSCPWVGGVAESLRRLRLRSHSRTESMGGRGAMLRRFGDAYSQAAFGN